MFDIEKLSIPAKAEAMRYGHTAVVNGEELLEFMNLLSGYLQKGEHYAIVPLGSVAGSMRMYSIRIIPVIQVKAHGF